jgi:hypothetical protein
MTESESQSFTNNSERHRPRRILKEQKARVKAVDGVLVPVRAGGVDAWKAKFELSPATSEPTPEPAKKTWPGKVYELAQKVRDDFEQTSRLGRGSAAYERALTAAYQQASLRWKQKNGKPIKPKVMRESLRRKDEEAKGYLHGGNLRGLRGR